MERLKNLQQSASADPQPARATAAAIWKDWLEALSKRPPRPSPPQPVLSILSELQAMQEVGPCRSSTNSSKCCPTAAASSAVPTRAATAASTLASSTKGAAQLRRGLPARQKACSRESHGGSAAPRHYGNCIGGLTKSDRPRAPGAPSAHRAVAAASSRLIFSTRASTWPRRAPACRLSTLSRSCAPRLPNSRAASFRKARRRGRPSRLDWPAPRDHQYAIDTRNTTSSRSIAPQTLRRRPARQRAHLSR